MARRLYLHIGPPKTGTTFLQAAWFQHRHDLAQRGVLYPGDHPLDQFRASAIALGKSFVTERLSAGQMTAWARLTDAIAAWDGDAILSSEHYALAPSELAREVLGKVSALADEVHLVVTARDLARQVPAAWQQSVKTGNDQTFDQFWRSLADDPSRGFWKAQDLPPMLERWTDGLAPDRVHVVVHGPPGSPRGLLWEQVCQVTGVEPGILRPVEQVNESLGVVHIEFLRRVNSRLPKDRDRIAMDRLTKSFITRDFLLPSASRAAMALPEAARAWAIERSEPVVEELRLRHYDIVGTLDDLIPARESTSGRTPDSVTDDEVAELATEVFARMLVELGESERLSKFERRVRRVRRSRRRSDDQVDSPRSSAFRAPGRLLRRRPE